jgi:hypothetical protein
VAAGVAFIQVDEIRVLRVHRFCVVLMVVASVACTQMAVARVLAAALTCVHRMVAISGVG